MKAYNDKEVNALVKLILESETAEFKKIKSEIGRAKEKLKKIFDSESGTIDTKEVSVIATATPTKKLNEALVAEAFGEDALELCKADGVRMNMSFGLKG